MKLRLTSCAARCAMCSAAAVCRRCLVRVHADAPARLRSVLDERREAFCGRQWVFDEIENWRRNCAEKCMLIMGEPGIGKSAIVADLVERSPGGQMLAYHCCRRDDVATLRPGRFVRSIAVLLAQRLDAFADRIAQSDIEEELSEAIARRFRSTPLRWACWRRYARFLRPISRETAPAISSSMRSTRPRSTAAPHRSGPSSKSSNRGFRCFRPGCACWQQHGPESARSACRTSMCVGCVRAIAKTWTTSTHIWRPDSARSSLSYRRRRCRRLWIAAAEISST
jgi:hypothetical protein